jgi:hypothetical protein
MAIGAITLTQLVLKKGYEGELLYRASFAGDGDYPTNGTAGFGAAVSAKANKTLTIVGVEMDGLMAGMMPVYDSVNDKLVVLDGALAEQALHANLSGTTFKLRIKAV